MTLQIFDMPQNSPEWIRARLGIPTASCFSQILAKGEGKTRKKYLYRLAGEILTDEPAEGYSNAAMERGHAMEPEARDMYAFLSGHEPQQVGFIRAYDAGCSPDSLLGSDGVLEIKTKQPDVLIEAMHREDYPPEHRAQVQGILWITGRQWVDLAMYWPKLPLVVRRITRDEGYIATLAGAVAEFNRDLAAVVEAVRKMGAEPLAVAA